MGQEVSLPCGVAGLARIQGTKGNVQWWMLGETGK